MFVAISAAWHALTASQPRKVRRYTKRFDGIEVRRTPTGGWTAVYRDEPAECDDVVSTYTQVLDDEYSVEIPFFSDSSITAAIRRPPMPRPCALLAT